MAEPQSPDSQELPNALRAAVECEIAPGERLLWVGRPRRPTLRFVRRLLAVNVLVGAVLIIHLIPPPWFDLWAAVFGRLPGALRYVVLAVMASQVALAAVALVRSAWADEQMWYAVTDRRVIVTEPRPVFAIGSGLLATWSYGPDRLGAMCCEEEEDGSGDLDLEEYSRTNSEGITYTHFRGMVDVPDVRRVERLVRDTLLCRAEAPDHYANRDLGSAGG